MLVCPDLRVVRLVEEVSQERFLCKRLLEPSPLPGMSKGVCIRRQGLILVNRAPLKDVHHVAKLAADNVVSIGSSLSHVHVPGRKVTEAGEDELTFEEVEIGMGKPNEHTETASILIVLCQASTTKQAPSERKRIYPTWSNKC